MTMHPKREENPRPKRPKVKGNLDDLIAAAWDAGWYCERTSRGHVMCYAPNGSDRVLVSGTTGDRHAAYFRTRAQFHV
jgi:hypothetical protein